MLPFQWYYYLAKTEHTYNPDQAFTLLSIYPTEMHHLDQIYAQECYHNIIANNPKWNLS